MQPRHAHTRRESPDRRVADPTRTFPSFHAGDSTGAVVLNAHVLPIDANAFGAEGDPPKVVTLEVIPPPGADGVLPAADGRRQRVTDAAQLAGALNAQMVNARVDFDHQSEPKSPTFAGTTEAEGWLAQYRPNARGGIDADVDLGPEALKRVRAKRYRYISPALLLNRADEVVGLSSIALVNNPNLPLSAPIINSGASPMDENELKTKETDLAERERKLTERESAAQTAALNAATQAVDGAIAANKIPPAHKEFFLDAIKGNPGGVWKGIESFNATIAERPSAVLKDLTRRTGPTGQPPGGTDTGGAYPTPHGLHAPSEERLALHAKISEHAARRGISYRDAIIEFGAIGAR